MARRKILAYLLALLPLSCWAISPMRLGVVCGQSMSPTLKNGSTYLLDRLYYRKHAPRRGDVVVFDNEQETMIKRIAAAPGDTIYLLRSTGADELVMDWQLSKVKRVLNSKFGRFRYRLIRRRVPEGYCYVLGDNLQHSMDSRTYGLVDTDNIRGRVLDCPPPDSQYLQHIAGVYQLPSHS